MQLWDDDKLEELIQEAELCDSKLPRSYAPKTEDEAISIFSRLILQGKIREAVRFITDRAESGGILLPDQDAGNGRTVMDILQSKHPDQSEPHPDAFVVCDALPTLIEVDVTAEHVQKVAKNLSGGAGVSGLDAAQ